MKKIMIAIVILVSLLLVGCTIEPTFDQTKNITVYIRDTTSGTRTGFMEGVGYTEAAPSDNVLVQGFLIKDSTANEKNIR